MFLLFYIYVLRGKSYFFPSCFVSSNTYKHTYRPTSDIPLLEVVMFATKPGNLVSKWFLSSSGRSEFSTTVYLGRGLFLCEFRVITVEFFKLYRSPKHLAMIISYLMVTNKSQFLFLPFSLPSLLPCFLPSFPPSLLSFSILVGSLLNSSHSSFTLKHPNHFMRI